MYPFLLLVMVSAGISSKSKKNYFMVTRNGLDFFYGIVAKVKIE